MTSEPTPATVAKIDVQIKIIGVLYKPQGQDTFTFSVEQGQTVLDLLTQLGYRKQHIPFIAAIINGRTAHHQQLLQQGDEIVLTLPVGGG